MEAELKEIRTKLAEASRTEAKPLKEQYNTLERKKSNY